NISFAAEDFPWEIFYPAFIKKSIDKDKDGFTKEQGDCNDSDSSINPDATEICGDGIDQDCNGSDLVCQQRNTIEGTWEGGMFPGNGISFEVEEINGENYVISASGWYVAIGCINEHYSWEANDLQNKIVNNECHIYFPDDLNFGDGRGMELHIYFDSDTELHGTWVGETFCDPLIEGTLRAYHCIDKDNDGYDSCNECDDDNADIHPDADEICDGVDNDCDGEIDEGLFYPDKDKDGYGDILDVGQSCPVPEGYVSDNTDCNDNDSTINPGAVEIPGDGIDQNCDERFTIMGDGTVRDPRTGLIWLKDASCSELAGTDEYGKANWDVATAAAAALADGTCGLTDGSSAGDWRLPTSSEFSGLVARKYRYPDLSNTAGTAQWSEGDPFNGVESGWHWSATDMIGELICRDSQGQPEGSVNCMYMGTGDVRYHSASDYFCKQIRNFQVWPVRSDN
ncbi:MAG: DUF1566 domain-containing protein, partial [ANME-2 cluster archaeon]|nr:DUF1566 domain-containing protein [ANME-2 cluster archaeon]